MPMSAQVASRTIAVQLESSFVGSIRAIEHVVVDKVGVYAYPLQSHGHQLAHTERSFQCALIASVHLEHRTKVVSLQTPYRISNKCALPLQVKVCVTQRTCCTVYRQHFTPHGDCSSCANAAPNDPQIKGTNF